MGEVLQDRPGTSTCASSLLWQRGVPALGQQFWVLWCSRGAPMLMWLPLMAKVPWLCLCSLLCTHRSCSPRFWEAEVPSWAPPDTQSTLALWGCEHWKSLRPLQQTQTHAQGACSTAQAAVYFPLLTADGARVWLLSNPGSQPLWMFGCSITLLPLSACLPLCLHHHSSSHSFTIPHSFSSMCCSTPGCSQ